jgi:hypothetical protein
VNIRAWLDKSAKIQIFQVEQFSLLFAKLTIPQKSYYWLNLSNLTKFTKIFIPTGKPVLLATSEQRPTVNNDQPDPQNISSQH